MDNYICTQCSADFEKLARALDHAIRNHNMTRQQAQNEIKIHKGKPRKR